MTSLSPRLFLLLCVLCASVLSVLSCERRSPATSATPSSLTLYSSVDDPLLRQLVAEFGKRHPDIKVNIVGDTEATKTTGLVQRLLSEKAEPRADVWWSNELLGTQLLADQGLFEPFNPPADLPAQFQDPQRRFHAFALRARVIAYSPKRVAEADIPRRLTELTDPKWKNRIGMARPQFGTTRAHMTHLLINSGEPALRAWLKAMKANNIRLYDGNSAVVRAVAQGEIDVCLTDTDDVFSAQRENWPVSHVFEADDRSLGGLPPVTPAATPNDEHPLPRSGRGQGPGSSPSSVRSAVRDPFLLSTGPLLIPNSIALIKGAPRPDAGKTFIAFVLAEDVERLLAESDSHNTPLRPAVRGALGSVFDRYAIPLSASDPSPPQLERLDDLVARAMRICEDELGS